MCVAAALFRREHQPRDQRRRFFLHRRDGVRVGVQRDRDGGMAEALGDDFGVDAGPQGQGGVSVSQVVRADRGQLSLLDRLPEVAADDLGVVGGTVFLGADVTRVSPSLAPLLLRGGRVCLDS